MNTRSTFIPLERLVTGYPRLAGQMGLLPELAMFRSFSALNAQILLYLQAEIIQLEQKLRGKEITDSRDPHGARAQYALDWDWLKNSANDGNTEQLDILEELKEKLKEYNKILAHLSVVFNLEEPSDWDRNDIQKYLQSTNMGPLALIGRDAGVWGSTLDPKGHAPDLVVLRPRLKKDAFCNRFTDAAVKAFVKLGLSRWKSPSELHGTVIFDDATLDQISFLITTVPASVLPIVSISILYHVQSIPLRIGVSAVFNIVLSICLVWFTTAKRADVFAITAAFSAVQVVFIGTNTNSIGAAH